MNRGILRCAEKSSLTDASSRRIFAWLDKLYKKSKTQRWFAMMIVPAVLLPFSPVLFAQTSEQSGTANAPAAAAALSHDLSGVWIAHPDSRFPDLPGMDVVNQAVRPALTPWGQARFDAAYPIVGPRAVAGEENDPVLRCVPDGPPMLLTLPNPFEIVQIPGRVLTLHEETHVWRTIWADGRALPKNLKPTWLGYSVGRWEGDTFVVDTVGFNDRLWADAFGDPRSEQMHLTERYRRLSHDTLELQITIDDPKAYARPWVNPPKLYKLEPNWEIAEWHCVVEEDKAYDDVVRKPAGGSPSPK